MLIRGIPPVADEIGQRLSSVVLAICGLPLAGSLRNDAVNKPCAHADVPSPMPDDPALRSNIREGPMPYFLKVQKTVAGLAMISTVMTVMGPSALGDTVEIRALVKTHYERSLSRLDLGDAKEAALRGALKTGIAERIALFERNGFAPGKKPNLHRMRAIKGEMHQIDLRQRARLAGLLSAEEFAQWIAMEDALKDRLQARMGPMQ